MDLCTYIQDIFSDEIYGRTDTIGIGQLNTQAKILLCVTTGVVGGMILGSKIPKEQRDNFITGYVYSKPRSIIGDHVTSNINGYRGTFSTQKAIRLLTADYLNATSHMREYVVKWHEYAVMDWEAEPIPRRELVSTK